MKHLKLFEGYNEDIASEKERHKKAIADIEQKYTNDFKSKISSILNCFHILEEEFEFQRMEIVSSDEQANDKRVLYTAMSGDEKYYTLLTQEMFNEIIKTFRKVEATGSNFTIAIRDNGRYQIKNKSLRDGRVMNRLKFFIGKTVGIDLEAIF